MARRAFRPLLPAVALGAAAGALWIAADRIIEAMTAPTRPDRPNAEGRRGFTPFETGVRWEDDRRQPVHRFAFGAISS